MAEPPVHVYYTYPFAQDAKQHLEMLLAGVSEWLTFASIPYDQAHNGLSPSQLFQLLGNNLAGPYVVIADQRTATEINAPTSPTVIVAAAWEITLGDEWDLYRGSQDLDSMTEAQRIAFLRGLAEQRANQEAQESGGEEWFWEPNSDQRGIDAILWQVKSVRADLEGVGSICSVYSVKDVRDMHLYFKHSADNSGGVFHPTPT